VIAAPVVYAVTYANDDPAFLGLVESFIAALPASSYWPKVTQDYGVGALAMGGVVSLSDSAPDAVDDAQVQALLESRVADGTFVQPTANTVFAIFYPANTVVTANGGEGCATFGTYHGWTTLTGGQDVAYVVVPRCSNVFGRTVLDQTTSQFTRGLLEAVTDPYADHPAFGQVDDDHIVWQLVLGAEAGGLCSQDPSAFFVPSDLTSMVQKGWSSSSIAAGHDPCIPLAAGQAYFNSAPAFTDHINLGASFNHVTTLGALIPLGQSKTVELDLYSDAPTNGPWTVSAAGYDSTTELSFALDKTAGANGDKIHMTITANTAGSRDPDFERFVVTSTLGSVSHVWVGAVGQTP
jgi:hypothetical protein